jgi:DinB superfamily
MDFLDNAITELASTPERMEKLVQGLSESQQAWKPSPEIFSVRESVLHLRDIEIEGYAKRLRMVLVEECPLLPDIDGGRLAQERNYNAQSTAQAIADFRRSRASSVEQLKACSHGDLARKAEMQDIGVIDLRRLLELWMKHDRGHLADIAEVRRAVELAGSAVVD